MIPACLPRSRGNLLAVLDALDVENNPDWIRRDVTGDGKPETWCNAAVEAGCAALEVHIPRGLLANQQLDWLDSADGRRQGWEECSQWRAGTRAEAGYPVLVAIHGVRHGHIGFCVPSIGSTGLHVWAAGRNNYSNVAIEVSFGKEDPKNVRRFFTNE